MNAYPYIKNIVHEKVLKIADQVNADADQVVSKTLAQKCYTLCFFQRRRYFYS